LAAPVATDTQSSDIPGPPASQSNSDVCEPTENANDQARHQVSGHDKVVLIARRNTNRTKTNTKNRGVER
jgi:hypothetical protein